MTSRWTFWVAIAVLAAFVVFDVCGRRRATPLPGGDAVAAVAAANDATPVDFELLAEGARAWPDGGGAPVVVPVSPAVRALDGRRVAVAGYMLPTQVEEGRARTFLLCRWPGGCCFGGTIEPDDLVECRLADGSAAEITTHVPIVAVGVFRVRDPASPGAISTGLYEMEVGSLSAP